MKESILIVGGYGKVGGHIARQLCSDTTRSIIIAGRSLEKAQAYCKLLDGRIQPAQLDLDQPDIALLEQMDVVIMCHEHNKVSFARQCLELGIHYIDISASYDWLKRLEALDNQAKASGAAAVLSVGFSPGLTNLMAMHAASQLEQVEQLDIGVLLGTGEAHGTAAINWLLGELLHTFKLRSGRGSVQKERAVKNFSERKVMQFAQLGKRSCYRFNFSDQHTLYDGAAAGEVGTYLTFDMEWLNKTLALLHRNRITSLLRKPSIEAAAVKLIHSMSIGSKTCAIHVEAKGKGSNGRATAITLNYTAEQEAVQTAKVAAGVARLLLSGKVKSGVHHIEQLFQLDLPPEADELTVLNIRSRW